MFVHIFTARSNVYILHHRSYNKTISLTVFVMYIDSMYWYFAIPGLLFTLVAQLYVKYMFNKYSAVDSGGELTGEEVAKLIRDKENFAVAIETSQEPLGDHFDPRNSVVRLSKRNSDSRSVADIAVVAHEFGHVEQMFDSSFLFRFRQGLVPITNVGTQIGYLLFFVGLAFSFFKLAEIGLAFFSTSVLFSLITLPIEIDASRRGLRLVKRYGVISQSNIGGARGVLSAAAFTYFAGLLSSVLNLLYYVNMLNTGRRRRN